MFESERFGSWSRNLSAEGVGSLSLSGTRQCRVAISTFVSKAFAQKFEQTTLAEYEYICSYFIQKEGFTCTDAVNTSCSTGSHVTTSQTAPSSPSLSRCPCPSSGSFHRPYLPPCHHSIPLLPSYCGTGS